MVVNARVQFLPRWTFKLIPRWDKRISNEFLFNIYDPENLTYSPTLVHAERFPVGISCSVQHSRDLRFSRLWWFCWWCYFRLSSHVDWLVEANVSEKRAVSIFRAEVCGRPGTIYIFIYMEPRWCQYSVWLRSGWPGFDPRQGQRIFPLTSASRPALGPTQPPIQWLPGALSPGVKRGRGVMLTTHPLLVSSLINSRSYTSSHPNEPLWSVAGPLYLLSLYVYIHIYYRVVGRAVWGKGANRNEWSRNWVRPVKETPSRRQKRWG
jgi:hypothetical protein